MAGLTPLEIKQALLDAGLEVYRTMGQEVIVADRPRENLILDSGVRVRAGEVAMVCIVMGLRRGQFPSETDAQVFDRLRRLALPASTRGFQEERAGTVDVTTAEGGQLDQFVEIVMTRPEPDVASLLELVRFALDVAKTAESRH